jgi:hypothetical protein
MLNNYSESNPCAEDEANNCAILKYWRKRAQHNERHIAMFHADFIDFCHSTNFMKPTGASARRKELFTQILSGINALRQERDDLNLKNKNLNGKLWVKDREQSNLQEFPEKAIQMLPECLVSFRSIPDKVTIKPCLHGLG